MKKTFAAIILSFFISTSSFSFILEAITIGSTALGVLNSVSSGKASKAAAAAQQAQFNALLKKIDSLQLHMDELYKEIENIDIKINELPYKLEFRSATLSTFRSFRLILDYSSILLKEDYYADTLLIESYQQRLFLELNEVERQIYYFKNYALQGNLQAITNMAILQESYNIAYTSLAYRSADNKLKATIHDAIQSDTSDEISHILDAAGIGSDKISNPKETTSISPFYKELIFFLEEQELFWEDISLLFGTEGEIGKSIIKNSPITGCYTSLFIDINYSDYIKLLDTINYVNASLNYENPSYLGTLSFPMEDILFIALPINVEVFYTDEPDMFGRTGQYTVDIPFGAYTWRSNNVDSKLISTRKGIEANLKIPSAFNFFPFDYSNIKIISNHGEIEPLDYNWEKNGLKESGLYSNINDNTMIFTAIPKSQNTGSSPSSLSFQFDDEQGGWELMKNKTLSFNRSYSFDSRNKTVLENLIKGADPFYISKGSSSITTYSENYIEELITENFNLIMNVIAYSTVINALNSTQDSLKRYRQIGSLL